MFAYKLHDKVTIVELERPGRVIGLYFCEDGAQYRIRYFYDGVARIEYFFADELCAA